MHLTMAGRLSRRVATAVLLTAGMSLATETLAGQSRVQAPTMTLLSGTIANAPSTKATLILSGDRRSATADDHGSFSFSFPLREAAYAELQFDVRRGEPLRVFLMPGQPLALNVDASDILGTASFSGATAPENEASTRLLSIYGHTDFNKLAQSTPDEFLRLLQQLEVELTGELAQASTRRPLQASFRRIEAARIKYGIARLRVLRLGLSGDWSEFASRLDFNDPSLLSVDAYSGFLSSYVKARAAERSATDVALKASGNQAMEARYAVAMETFKNRAVRNAQLHSLFRDLFDAGADGPFGCKGIESLMSRFDQAVTDPDLRADIDKPYHECLANRNAPVIRPYKTVGAISLDAHIFPAAGARPGAKNAAYLFFHGAGWSAGMPEWGYGDCRHLAAEGIVCLSIEYRLRWRHGTTPIESVADAKSAVRWTRLHAAELGVDPDRIVAAGFSAGGHLAAATAMVPGYDEPGEDTSVSSVPNAVVLSSAPVDPAADPWFIECLAGRGDARALSPVYHVRGGLPPMIVFQGMKDYLVDFARTEAFCKDMQAAGNRCELITFSGSHFRDPADGPVVVQRTDEFLRSLGYLERD